MRNVVFAITKYSMYRNQKLNEKFWSEKVFNLNWNLATKLQYGIMSTIYIFLSSHKGGRYSIFPGGELHIRNVTMGHGKNTFRCLAKNILTGRKTVSSIGGR